MKKVSYLEGLRGICCFIVIIDHCINAFKPDIRYTGLSDIGGALRRIIAWTPLNIIYSGIAPVCIFFILSGFVLSLKFNKTKDPFVITSGVIKRYPRLILPILAAMIMMYVLYFLLHKFTGIDRGLSLWMAVSQALYYAPFEHVSLMNYALWTISFEIYGSLLVFSLLAIFGNNKYKFHIYILTFLFLYFNKSFYALFVFGMILSDLLVNQKYHLSRIIRICSFIIGIILSTTPYARDGVELNKGVYSYLNYFSGIEYSTVYQVMMLTGSMFLFAAILDSSLFKKIFDLEIFLFLGRISFPLYITHSALLTVVAYVLKQYTNEVTLLNFVITVLITIPVCLAVSWAFEKFIDLPSINIANKLAKKVK